MGIMTQLLEEPQTLPVPLNYSSGESIDPRKLRANFHRAAVGVLVACILVASLLSGLKLRVWLWEKTRQPETYLRLNYDIENAYHWGTEVMRDATFLASADPSSKPTDWKYWIPAYVGLYARVEHQAMNDEYQLDYTPARLLTMSLWVRHMRVMYPMVTVWQPQYPYSAPLMWLNITCELLACLAAFLLVRLWVRRGQEARQAELALGGVVPILSKKQLSRGWVAGLVAALLIWWSPAVLCDAHVWPQWEVWILPVYLFALYLASHNRWLAAGALVAAGAMMKGQIVMVSALFVLWPLFELRIGAAIRFVIGFALSSAILLSPWLVPSIPAAMWVGGMTIVAAILAGLFIGRHLKPWAWLAAPMAALLAVWPWLHFAFDGATGAGVKHFFQYAHWGDAALLLAAAGTAVVATTFFPKLAPRWRWILAITLGLVAASYLLLLHHSTTALIGAWAAAAFVTVVLCSARLLPRRAAPFWVAGVFTAAIFLGSAAYHANFAWYRVSFEYPTRHWKQMPSSAANMQTILANPPYNWHLTDHVWERVEWAPSIHGHVVHLALPAVEFRTLLGICYFVCLGLCALGTAMKNRRHDPRILLAFAAPWLLMFVLMPQMHERYLVWGAVISALGIGVSVGYGLMHVLITALSFWLACRTVMIISPRSFPAANRFIAGFFPSLGWVILLIAMIYLYQSLAPRRREA
ncbi:MAG: hypothetical protein JWL69_1081 [Phycisphaerales bacterium]|nr:hypothetical protein [Phycisphaerales bacterium]MDB5356348.1 hypothetical protein [Phycisphaerales bacterium]